MPNSRKRLLAVLVSGALAGTLAACGGDGGGDEGSSNKSSATGGTMYYLMEDPIEHLDPQRVYVGRDISNLSRTVYRTLVTFPASEDPDAAQTPVPDLATDTGTSKNAGKEWSFTVKDGVKWEDGQPV
jgi:peptide/nickel transport system substrate-binding protein